jgi:hypothetical protein
MANAESLLPLVVLTLVAAVIAASGFFGYGVVDAWQERQSRGQLPPRPTQRRRALEGKQQHRPGDDLILCQAPMASCATGHRDHGRLVSSRTDWVALAIARMA